jgi:hypothetical protein
VSRRLLEDAAGYVVYGSDGRRLGKVIELVTGGEERADSLAIRRERIFLWRRRTVPVVAVAGIDPQERTVTLLLDSTSIERAHELHNEGIRQGSVAERIAHYFDPPPIPEAEAPALDVDAAGDGHTPIPVLSEDDLASATAEPVGEAAPSQHVLFAPTAAGYLLIERDGLPPPRAGTLELSDPPGRFEVVKLAQSPLPNDQRPCAFLDRID